MRRLAVIALVLALAACASAAQTPPPAVATARPVALPATPPAPPAMDPRALIGMASTGLTELLGAPLLLRRDAPAEIWQYGTADCVLDLTLYPDENQVLSVRYMESRARNGFH